MNKKHIFILIFGLWLIIIVAFIGFKQFTLSTGTRVLLKTAPVDPRDILRGDYVALNYEIGRLNLDKIPHDLINPSKGDRIYLILEGKEKYWVAKEIRKDKPENLLFIEGETKNIYGNEIIVNYGIESYFIPEGKGSDVEGFGGKGLDVEVSIDRFGHAVINKLYINGTEVNFNND
jgi:uncharacterized membrane-anchored protein